MDINEYNKSDITIEEKNEISDEVKEKLISDPFWLDNYKVLFAFNNLDRFFPSKNMTLVEKLNAIFRLSIYLSIGLYLVSGNYLYFYIMIIVGLFTIYIYKSQKDNIELYFNTENESFVNNVNEAVLERENLKVKPTVENPFMNINLITDNKTKERAPSSWNNKKIQENIEDKFGYNLYRDVGDLYGKSNSQREYYTMPSTTIPNNQTAFAKWLYNTGPTCKEKSIHCTPQMDPVPFIDQTNPYLFTNQKI